MGGQVLRMNAATIATLAGESAGSVAPTVALSLPFPTSDRTIFGGFVQSADWTVDGGEPAAFELELSLDDGATFEPLGGELPGSTRSAPFLVATALHSRTAVLRLTAALADGRVVSALTDPFRLRRGKGPSLRGVRFPRTGEAFVLTGRFDAAGIRVEVNGVPVDSPSVLADRIRGNTCDRITVDGVRIDELFPSGVEVGVVVVDSRTGLATPELRVKR